MKHLGASAAQAAILWAKRLVYGDRGEPYRVGDLTLRYVPGSRPVRTRHKSSRNSNARYDALQVEWLCSHLKPGDTVIDVGAHVGEYSVLIAALCGSAGQVVAFEPDPYARAIFSRNFELNPALKPAVLEAAAIDRTGGETVLYSRQGNSQSSLARSAVEFRGDRLAEEICVDTTSLDDYIARNPLLSPACIKIDAEGAEIRILQGAKSVLKTSTRILCELHPYAWDELGSDFAELLDLVAESGRRMYDLDTESGYPQVEAKYCTVVIEHA